MKTARIIIWMAALILASCSSSETKKGERDTFETNKYYIIEGDTIAELLSVNVKQRMADIKTKRMYANGDDILVTTAIDKLVPKWKGITFFLYHKDYPEWYASFHEGALSIKIKAPKKEPDYKLLHGEIQGKGLDYVNIFFARLDMFKEKLRKDTGNKKLRSEIIKYQKNNFPKARREYYEHVKDVLWKKDIKVKLTERTIKYYGYMFIRNQVIDDTYQEIKEELIKLRFTKIHFGASEGVNEYSYTLDVKKDNEI